MKKKYIIGALIILAVLASSIFFIKVYKDLKKERQIRNEVQIITKDLNTDTDENETEIYKVLDNRIINKGPYHKVEDAIKTYYKDLYSSYKNLHFIISEEKNYLSNDNLEDFAKNYSISKDQIINGKAQTEELYLLFKSYIEDENKIKSYIIEKDLDNYYNSFYMDLVNETFTEERINNLDNSYKRYINNLEVYNEALDFLNTKKNKWKINEGIIVFDKVEDYEAYTNITSKLQND